MRQIDLEEAIAAAKAKNETLRIELRQNGSTLFSDTVPEIIRRLKAKGRVEERLELPEFGSGMALHISREPLPEAEPRVWL